MDGPQKWKRTLKSGYFRRKVHVYQNTNPSATFNSVDTEKDTELGLGSESTFSINVVPEPPSDESGESSSDTAAQDYSSGDYSPDEELNLFSDTLNLEANQEASGRSSCQVESLTVFLRNWSLQYNISHQALKPLLQKLNNYERTLPESPRLLLRTPRINPTIIDFAGGQYWHQGLGNFHVQKYVKFEVLFNYFYYRILSSYVLPRINRAVIGGNQHQY